MFTCRRLTAFLFHGGGFKNGDKANQEAFCQHMTGCGIAVVSANYRMYPGGAKYPDFVEDAATAVAWVFAKPL